MAKITPARLDTGLQEEELRFRAPISENTWTRIGGSINFINDFQVDKHAYHFNGDYSLGAGSTGADGVFPFLFNAEIVGISYYFGGGSGLSGATTIDIHEVSSTGADQGTIFTTKPSVADTAANGSSSVIQVNPANQDNTVVTLATGHTAAVFSKTRFDSGAVLRADIDAATTGSNNFQLTFFFRPRN